jgi:myo-inositol 2-dehydrogenase / D-chiro-inositol 1-dehydrogenase
MKNQNNSRRNFLKNSTAFAAGAIIIPTIVPSTVFGKTAPSNQINVGMIATGRQAVNANLEKRFFKLDNCRVIAINDVDSWRMSHAEKVINDAYSKAGKSYSGVKKYDDYREVIANKDVDAVMVSYSRPLARTANHCSSSGRQTCFDGKSVYPCAGMGESSG